MTRANITNFLLFQLGWFACVLGGAHDQVTIGCIIVFSVIAYHLFQAKDALQELRLLIVAFIIGLIFESIITANGVARYSHGQFSELIAPFWMILMWPLFATTINLSMRWLKALSPLLVAVTGAIFAPLAYFAGSRLGAVNYDDLFLAMTSIAIAWAILFPALVVMSLKLDGFNISSPDSDTQRQAQNV